jgi:DNA-binding beta-propeller fold protein YncE
MPYAVAVDSFGKVWTANQNDNSVSMLQPTTGIIKYFQVGTKTSSDPLSTKYNSGIAVDSKDNILVTNTKDNKVYKLDNTGKQIASYAVGKLPYGIAIGSNDVVWVTNFYGGESNASKIDATGKITSVLSLSGASGIAVNKKIDGDEVWVANYSSIEGSETRKNVFLIKDSAVSSTESFGLPYKALSGLAIDKNGDAHVVSNYDAKLIKIHRTGANRADTVVASDPSVASGLGPVALDGVGKVWATNMNNNTKGANNVLRFDLAKSTTLADKFKTGGARPSGIVYSARDNNMYIAGFGDNAIYGINASTGVVKTFPLN